MVMSRIKGEKTKYPGVYRLGENLHLIRAQVPDPRTGKRKQAERQFEGTAKEAADALADLARKLVQAPGAVPAAGSSLPRRPTVGDFAIFWLASKHKLDPGTRDRYTTALDLHALPHRFEDGTVLGSMYFDMVRPADVQAWVNAELAARDKKGGKLYGAQTVHGWFRVFRTMARKAVVQLRLTHDPSMLIEFPELDAKHEGENRLTVLELQPFLDELRMQAPQHHAITCVLAWTGLRFCHASALMWDDVGEHTLHVRRKNVKGRIGKVSKKKPAPTVLPLDKELADILRWHRRELMRISAGEKRVGDWARQGLAEGWVFPARGRRTRKDGVEGVGPIHSSGSLRKSWEKTLTALQEAGKLDGERFTVHGLRRTFNDLLRQNKVDELTRKKLTQQSTEVREDYQTVDVEEMREAMKGVREMVRSAPPQRG